MRTLKAEPAADLPWRCVPALVVDRGIVSPRDSSCGGQMARKSLSSATVAKAPMRSSALAGVNQWRHRAGPLHGRLVQQQPLRLGDSDLGAVAACLGSERDLPAGAG